MVRSTVSLALILSILAAAVPSGALAASDLLRQGAFSRLHRLSDPYDAFHDNFLLAGFQIVGERIHLENGQLTVSIQRVSAGDFSMENLGAQAAFPLGDAFFADPLAAGVNNFLTSSTITVAKLSAKTVLVSETTQEQEIMNVDVKDIRIAHNQKVVKGHLKVLIFPADFSGKSSYSKTDKKLTVTVESISMGGIPVPLDLAFFIMKQIISFDFIQIQKPNIIFNLGAFLPQP